MGWTPSIQKNVQTLEKLPIFCTKLLTEWKHYPLYQVQSMWHPRAESGDMLVPNKKDWELAPMGGFRREYSL